MGLLDNRDQLHATGLQDAIIAANQIIRSNRLAVNILDARYGQQGEGPHFGDPVEPGFLLFSTDPVAIDSYAARLMGFEPRSIRTITLAAESGLGSIDAQISGDPLSPMQFTPSSPWEFATLGDGRVAVFSFNPSNSIGQFQTYRLSEDRLRYFPEWTKIIYFNDDRITKDAADAWVFNDADNFSALSESHHPQHFFANAPVRFENAPTSGLSFIDYKRIKVELKRVARELAALAENNGLIVTTSVNSNRTALPALLYGSIGTSRLTDQPIESSGAVALAFASTGANRLYIHRGMSASDILYYIKEALSVSAQIRRRRLDHTKSALKIAGAYGLIGAGLYYGTFNEYTSPIIEKILIPIIRAITNLY